MALALGPFLVRKAGAGQFAGTADSPLGVLCATPTVQTREQSRTRFPKPCSQ